MRSTGFARNGRRGVHSFLAGELSAQVLHDSTMLGLRAKEDDFSICADSNRMARGPVEKVSTADGFFGAIAIGEGDLAFQHISPVWRLAEIGLQSLEKRCDIGSPLEGKVFAGHWSVAGCVAEIEVLAGNRAGNIDACLYILPSYFHNVIELVFG